MTMNLEKKVDNIIISKIPKDLFQKQDFYPLLGIGTSSWKFLKEIFRRNNRNRSFLRYSATIAIDAYNLGLVIIANITAYAGYCVYNLLKN